MPTKRRKVPSYRLHKPSGQARVILDGEHIYLGKFGSPESHEKYDRLVAEWLVRHRASSNSPASTPSTFQSAAVTVNDLLLAFWHRVKQRYVKDGKPTSEQRSFRTALRPVRQLYGHELAANFGPLALVACRQKLVEAGICRRRINQHVSRIRLMFKWGVAREMVPETVFATAPRVQPGRTRTTSTTRIRRAARTPLPLRPPLARPSSSPLRPRILL
jgi:hypothetical protein